MHLSPYPVTKKCMQPERQKNIFSMKFIDALAAGKAKGKGWEK